MSTNMESHREKKVDKKPHQEDGPRRKRVKQAGDAKDPLRQDAGGEEAAGGGTRRDANRDAGQDTGRDGGQDAGRDAVPMV